MVKEPGGLEDARAAIRIFPVGRRQGQLECKLGKRIIGRFYRKVFLTNRFGLYLDVLEEFQLMIPAYRNSARDWQSGKEAADWIAYNLEEQGRLTDEV